MIKTTIIPWKWHPNHNLYTIKRECKDCGDAWRITHWNLITEGIANKYINLLPNTHKCYE